MAKFVLTAQLQLQAPTNIRQVVGQIRNQLANTSIKVPVEVEGAKRAKDQIKGVTDETKKATSAAQALGKSFGLAVKRFAAFTVASRAVSLFTNSLANAVEDAIDFQREIIKISQVTGQSVKQLRGLKKTITDLSTGLGVVSKDLLAVTRILSQASVRGSDLEVALSALAKTTLAPTFDDITQTAEGAVAILRQFGQGVGALEGQLGSINRVAGQFAVESGDLIGAVRRFGGVFKSAGGDLNELLALFTSVRQTTRESAESISTGLRTIFTRIQRPETIEFLRQFNIELETADGRFKGPLKAARLLGDALANLPQGDLKFISIAEELGGFRQIGKVIPLLQQTEVTERALAEARNENNSLTEDAAKAQAALATQITKVKEEFQALVRSIAESGSFQILISGSLKLASALIKVVDAVKPLIPLLATLGTIKLAQGLGGFFAGAGKTISNIQSKSLGGTIQKFASGGFVPGSGNGDTVPAMLTPGEFVIKKSSAKSLGAGTLSAMNENRFALGGIAKEKNIGVAVSNVVGDVPGKVITEDVSTPIEGTPGKDIISTNPGFGALQGKSIGKIYASKPNASQRSVANINAGNSSNTRVTYEDLVGIIESVAGIKKQKDVNAIIEGTTQNDLDAFDTILNETAQTAIGSTASRFASKVGGSVPNISFSDNFKIDAGVRGKLFEDVIDALQDVPIQGGGKSSQLPFDLTNGIKPRGTLYEELARSKAKYVEVKTKASDALKKDELPKKLRNQLATELVASAEFQNSIKETAAGYPQPAKPGQRPGLLPQQSGKKSPATQERNSGGGISGSGTDTVPALLTPGEFVVNKSAAQNIGYSNLKSMNRTGVQKFAKGGAVGVQKFQNGGGVLGPAAAANAGVVIGLAQVAIQKFGDTSDEASDTMFETTLALQGFLNTMLNFGIIGALFLKVTQSINKWEKGVKQSTQAVEQNTVAEQQDTQQIKASSGPSSPSSQVTYGPSTKAQAEAEEALVADSQKRQARGSFGVGSLIPGSNASFARGEARISAIQNDPRKQVADEKTKRAKANLPVTQQAVENADKAVLASAKRNITARKEVENRTKLVLEAKKRQAVAEREVTAGSKAIDGYVHARGVLERSILDSKKKQDVAVEKSLAAEDDAARIQKRLNTLAEATRKQGGKRGKFDDPDRADVPLTKSSVEAETKELTEELLKVKVAARTAGKQVNTYSTAIEGNEKALEKVDKTEAKIRNKQKAREQELKTATSRATTASRKYRGAIREKSLAEKAATVVAGKLITATKLYRRAQKKLEGSLKESTKQALRLEKAERSLARSRAVRAGARRGAAAVGRGVAGVSAGLAIAATIAQQLGSYVQQISDRAAQKQQDQGNIAGSQKAAEAGALAQGISEVFSINGLIAAGTGGLDNLFDQIRDAVKFAGANQAVDTFKGVSDTVSKGVVEGGDFRNSDNTVDFATTTKKLAEGADQARAPLLKLAEDSKKRRELESQISTSLKKNISDYVANGASLEEATNAAVKFARSNAKVEGEYVKLAVSLVNAREAQQQVADANFESLKITSAFGAANAAVDAFTNGLTTGSDALGGYIAQIEGAQGSVGVDLSAAIDGLEQGILNSAGGTGVSDAISGQADTARVTASFLQNIGGQIDNTTLNRSSKSGAQSDLRDAVAKALKSVPIELKGQLSTIAGDQIKGITKENFQGTDISEFIGKIASESQKLYQGLLEGAKLQAAHNQKITGLYKQREETERKSVEAINKAIDAQFEAAKIFEDFGGEALTSDQALGGRLAQFNNSGAAAGVGLRTGNAGDIGRVASEIANVFNTQQNAALSDISNRVGTNRPGLFAGPEGVQNDQREEAKRANTALIAFTKQRIGLLKEELTLVQAKNREEKSALDKLISGDIEGFIKGQAAAGAGAALSTGSQGLTSLFSSSALGAGFKSLQDQGLSDRANNRAANLTLGGFGITDRNSAGVLSGTTAEEQAIKAEGRELARTFGDIAAQGADFERSEISIQTATIAATNLTFQSELENVALRNNPDFKSRGGPIYASRGMFVPRGTDTVPAMLTPGEFVVNRSAVQRGNNMQILRAMNSQGNGGASGPGHMSGGGRVHYNTGGVVEGINNAFASSLPELRNVFADFSAAVDRLSATQFSVKLDTTNVNVNLNGASFLATLKEDIKRELLSEVAKEIGNAKQNSAGDMELRKTVL